MMLGRDNGIVGILHSILSIFFALQYLKEAIINSSIKLHFNKAARPPVYEETPYVLSHQEILHCCYMMQRA